MEALEKAKPYLDMAANYKKLIDMGVTWEDPVAAKVRDKINQALSRYRAGKGGLSR